ncbi:MAG: serine protease [Granulosicoccus sp.]|nr:serine protease [Granulosicoccus sp.]
MFYICKSVLAKCLLFVICYSTIVAAQAAPRVIGGTTVPDDRYPFMVAVYYDPTGDGSFVTDCGGTIVGSRWIMTAAHCMLDFGTLEPIEASRVAIRAGVLDLDDVDQGKLIVAKNIYIHPNFSIETKAADIALIELAEPVNAPAISLPVTGSNVPAVGELANITGWGQIDTQGTYPSDLQEGSVQIVAYSQCMPFYYQDPQIDERFCAGGVASGGRNWCPGDAGGPIFVERDGLWVQAGISIGGRLCRNESNIPGVYTRLSSHTDWVAGIVPDLQTISDFSGILDNVNVPDDSEIEVLSADSPTSNGSLLQGEVAFFDVTGATRVNLHSLNGDADLIILAGTTVEAQNIVCISENIPPTNLDGCDVPSASERVFAIAYGYADTAYDITAVGIPENPEVSDSPVVADPPIAAETPAVPPNDESPAAAPIDDAPVSMSGGSSGGGTLSGLLLFMLSAIAFARGRYRRY